MSAPTKRASGHRMPVIAIGASAGGLEACSALLKALPGDMQAAFVLVLHLAPSHDSMVVDLLSRDTNLKVVPAADGMALRPSHLYVIPPGVYLTISQGVLHTTAPESGKPVRLPFDALLLSLAREVTSPLACVVLSGTGMDGSGGIDAIHKAGGLVLAQDPTEASYAGMPEAAIRTGLVDHVLTTRNMPKVLARLTPDPSARAPQPAARDRDRARPDTGDVEPRAAAPTTKPDPDFAAILALVAESAPQNVSLYKSGTIQRRIARRMGIAGCQPHETARYCFTSDIGFPRALCRAIFGV